MLSASILVLSIAGCGGSGGGPRVSGGPVEATVEPVLLTHAPITRPHRASGSTVDTTDVERQLANAFTIEQQRGIAPEGVGAVSDRAILSVFTGAEVASEKAGVGIAEVSHDLAGGIDWLQVTSLKISGATASAKGQVRIWLREPPSPSGHSIEPHNTLDFSAHLELDSGAWKVSAIGERFAPGQGP